MPCLKQREVLLRVDSRLTRKHPLQEIILRHKIQVRICTLVANEPMASILLLLLQRHLEESENAFCFEVISFDGIE